jgi:CBS domain-containing protein
MVLRQLVKHVMRHHKIQEVRGTDPVSKAVQLMEQCNISALPVRGSEGKYSGVISKTDIASLRFFQQLKVKGSPDLILTFDIMNRTTPIFVMEDDPLQKAVTLMYKRHIHRIFVADAEYQLTGVISTSDILRVLVVDEGVGLKKQ